ncbi:hypothetical protein [Streptomyces sp. NPDC058665]|uniref:hypothetical protein n=1 Tax=Streptomyces sp. NPDC058665 TaxID=3346586 RepID=UPI00364CD91A
MSATTSPRAGALAEQRHLLDPLDRMMRALAPGAEKTTPVGDCGHSATVAPALGRDVIRAIARDGLVLPRAPYPGQKWRPTTSAERHLLGEGRRLGRNCERLLAELGRMREQQAARRRRAATEDRPAGAAAFRECLTDCDLEALAAAALGETERQTAARLGLTLSAVKGRRESAAHRVGASTFARALVIATAAGVISPGGAS